MLSSLGLNLLFNSFNFNFAYQSFYSLVASLNNTYLNFFLIFLIISFFSYNQKFFFFLIFFNFFYLLYKYNCFFFVSKQLLIGLNNVHPPLFYFSLLIFVNLFFFNKNFIYFNYYFIIFCAIFALILGGFWGFGNTVWGFFWVNDEIEKILLFYCCLLVTILHFNYYIKYIYIYIYTYFLIFLYIYALRTGFIFTRHNFFDLKNLNNIIFSYLIFNYFSISSVIYIYILNFFFKFFLYLSLIKFFSKILLFNNYKIKLIFFHILIFSLFIGWLKTRVNNYIFYSVYIYKSITNFSMNFYNFTFFNYFFIFNAKKIIFFNKLFFLYTYKNFYNFCLVFGSYCLYGCVILILIFQLNLFFYKKIKN